MTWPSLLAGEGKGAVVLPQKQQVPEAETSRSVSGSGSTSGLKADAAMGEATGQEGEKKKKKNWDKIVDDDEDPDPSDPVRRPYPFSAPNYDTDQSLFNLVDHYRMQEATLLYKSFLPRFTETQMKILNAR